MSLLERCPHFRGCYVQASMELGPEDVSLLERCPHFRGVMYNGVGTRRCVPIRKGILISEGVMYRLQWSWDLKMCPY